jgi:hypothetical protein
MLSEPHCSQRKCRYFLGVDQPDGTEMTERPYCPAFPDGIPFEIAYGSDKHASVRSDQKGTFVFKKGTPTK